MDESTIELIDYLRVLWRRKWIILVTLAAAVVTAWIVGQAIASTYRVETSLLLLPPLSSELGAEPVGSRLAPEAYEELAVSTTLLGAVIESTPLPDDVTIERLKERVSVSVNRLSSGGEFLLTASIDGTDPQELSKTAQAWTRAFTETYGELFQDRTMRSFSYVSENYAATESELEDLIDERTAFLAANSIEVLKAEAGALRTVLTSNHQRLLTAQQELELAKAYLAARGQDPVRGFSTYVLTSAVDPNTLSGALAFGLSAEEYRGIVASEVENLEESIDRITNALAERQQQIDTAEADLSEINRRINLIESEHAHLATKLQEARIALAENPDPIRIIDEPLAPLTPIAPRNTLNIAIAGFLGLMVGTLLAFFVDYLARIREQEDAVKGRKTAASSDPLGQHLVDAQPQEDTTEDRELTTPP